MFFDSWMYGTLVPSSVAIFGLRWRHANYILLTNFGFRRKRQFYLKSVTTTRKVDGEDLLIRRSVFSSSWIHSFLPGHNKA
jgi:hypothetical protein